MTPEEGSDMADLEVKNFDSPDETRPFEGVRRVGKPSVEGKGPAARRGPPVQASGPRPPSGARCPARRRGRRPPGFPGVECSATGGRSQADAELPVSPSLDYRSSTSR